MLDYTAKIQDTAEKLLSACRVDVVLGFAKGSIPMMNEPCLIRDPDQAKRLVWDGNCGINLANYLPDIKGRVAVVAKGCDSRNIVTHIVENKIERERVHVIGVPCNGMIDRVKITSRIKEDIIEVKEADGRILVRTAAGETDLARSEFIQDNCRTCVHPNPVISDELVGDPVEVPRDMDRYEDVRRIEEMSKEDKRAFFTDMFKDCIRCYACRNACPLCYCPTCFVDESKPQWLGKGQDLTDILTFHFLRAYHCAGRCTDCGACQRACPMGINMRLLTKKLEKDCLDLFDWEAGMTENVRPPLDTYKPGDPDSFIK